MTVHKRATGEVHAMRRLAMATPVGLIETSGGQEDVQSFGWEAAENLRQAVHGARVVTACELLAGHGGALAGRPPPAGAGPVVAWLAGLVPPVTGDRPFGADIERLIGAPWPPPDRAPARRARCAGCSAPSARSAGTRARSPSTASRRAAGRSTR